MRAVPAPVPSATASTSDAPAAPVELPASDAFDGWSVSDGGSGARFTGTADHHGGTGALQVVRPGGDTATEPPTIRQTVAVAQDSEVELSFWARTSGSPADGAVQVRIGDTDAAVVALPAAATGWTRYTALWRVPPKVVSTTVAIVAAGETSGAVIDDVAVRGQGSRGVDVADGGFESSSAAVWIADDSLVHRPQDALHLRSRLSPGGVFRWRAEEYTGGAAVTGRGRFSGGAGTLPLDDLSAGYWALTLQVPTAGGVVERTTDLVVTGKRPEEAGPVLLGIGVHLGAADGQLQQKVADLAALGLGAARTDADWASIERTPGQYDFSGLDPVVQALEAAGLRPLLIPDYRNPAYDGGRTPSSPDGIAAYARFAAALAVHYPGADIDVYNEFDWRFNDGACGKGPSCYLSLLGPTATAVRSSGASPAIAGPDIAGLGVQQEWLQGFVDGGGLASVDALDLHPYVQPDRPDVLDDQLDALQATLAAAGRGDLPVWFTEFGVSTADGWLSERRQAEDAARLYGVAAAHGVDRVYWYDAIDDGPDAADLEDRFGLFRSPDFVAPAAFVPKPAAAVLATAVRQGAGRTVTASALGGPVSRVALDGTALEWAADGSESTARAARGAVSMTGRPLGRTVPLGSAPVWVPAAR